MTTVIALAGLSLVWLVALAYYVGGMRWKP
jgi:hypothetical protein